MDDYPDEHPDEDSSLGNLHYGLDSSADENASGAERRDLSAVGCAGPGISPRETVLAENQMNLLQDMVLEMKEGFQTALEELMKIQIKEEAEASHSKKLQQQQQEQLAHLTEVISEIKHELSSLTKSVEQIKDEQRMLKDGLEEVRSNRDSLQEHRLLSDRSNLPEDLSSHSEEGHSKFSGVPSGISDHNVTRRISDHNVTSRISDHNVTGRISDHNVTRRISDHNVTSRISDHNVTGRISDHNVTRRISDHNVTSRISDHNVTSRNDEDVTATACKSLSLTQALREECRRFNISQSSGDEEEDQGSLRMSNYRQNQAHLVSDQMVDRQHNFSVYAGLQDRRTNVHSTVQRQKAVTELADSEREYCSQLWSLHQTYLTSLQTAGLLSNRELDILIPPYLDQLYTEHCHICSELQDRLMHWTFMSSVADLLSRVADSYNSDSLLSLYQEYANDLPLALSILRRALAQSSEFQIFLKAVKHSSCQNEDLMSLLLSPVQRIPKYLLQVQEISRQTPPSHADFPHLQTLLHQLQNFVDQLNDVLFNTVEDLNHDGHASHVPSEWIESPYHTAHQRQTWASPARRTSLSHSDLSVYNKISNVTSEPLFAHIPRSQTVQPATSDSSNYAAARQLIQKFKVKMRSPSPARYSTKGQDYNQHTVSPEVRPASSVDFLKHHNHHQQQKQHPSDVPEQPRSYQHPVPQPRSKSALGLHAMSASHRPVVISRKNIKRPQSSVRPSSDMFWNESNRSGTLPTNLNPQKTHLTDNNFQSVTHKTSNIVNDHPDEEDDTRASDINSLGTGQSYSYIHRQDLNGGHESELNLEENHLGSQSSQNKVPDCDSAHSPAIISANVSQKCYNTQREATRDDMRQASSKVSNSKTATLKEQPSTNKSKDNEQSRFSINQIKENQPSRSSTNKIKVIQSLRPATNQMKVNQQSRCSTNQIEENQSSKPLTNKIKDNQHSTNQIEDNVNVKKESLILSSSKDIDKSVSSSAIDTKQDYEEDSAVLPSKNCVRIDYSVSQVSSAEQDFLEGSNERSRIVPERIESSLVQGSNKRSRLVQERNERSSVVQERNERSSVVQERNKNTIVQGINETNSLVQGRNEMSRRVQGRNESSLVQGRNETNGLVQGRNETNSLIQGRNETNSHVQERNESSLVQGRDYRSNLVNTIPHSEKIVHNVEIGAQVERPAQVSENNRQLLMSLTNKVSLVEKTNMNKASSANSTETSADDFSSINSHLPINSESLYPDLKADSSKAEPPRSSKAGNSHISQVPAMGSPLGKANTKPALPPKRHLQTPVSSPASSTNSARASSDSASSLSPLKYGPDVNQGMFSSNRTYSRSHSSLSNDPTNLSGSTNNHRSPSKLTPLSSSSAPRTIDVTTHTSKTATTLSLADLENGYSDLISYHDERDLQPLSMADLHSEEGKRERRKEMTKKEMKDGDVTDADNLQLPTDNNANSRKKSHFKASFKNLFTKKKGRVILADVEKEVLKEMATVAALPSEKTAALKNIKFTKSKITGNLGDPNFLACTQVTESTFEIKNRRDQASSTSSPVKANRKLNFCTKQDTFCHCSACCSGFNCSECGQLQLQQNTVDHIKPHIKQQDSGVLEMTDKDIAKVLDGSVDSGCSLGQGDFTNSHPYTGEMNIPTESQLVQESVRESPPSLHKLTDSSHCQQSLTESPSSHQSLTESPSSHQSLTKSPSSQQSLTESPSSQQGLHKSLPSQQCLIKSLALHQKLTEDSYSHHSLNKSPSCHQSLTTSHPFQQLPQNKMIVNNTSNTAVKSHSNPIASLDTGIISWHCQNQNNSKDMVGIRTLVSNETDLVKSASNVCNNGHQVCLHCNDKADNSSVSECRVIPRKLQYQLHKELHREKSLSAASYDFCQQCKKYEIRAEERIEEAGDDSKNIDQRVWADDEDPGRICRSSRTVSRDFKSSDNIQDSVNHSLFFQSNIGNDTDSLKTLNGNCTGSLKLYNGNHTDNLKPYFDNGTDSLKTLNDNCTSNFKPYIGNCTDSLKTLNDNCNSLKLYNGNCTGSLRPYIDNDTDSFKILNGNCSGSLQKCVDGNYMYTTSKKLTLSNKQPLLDQTQTKNKHDMSISGTLEPNCKRPNSWIHMQGQFKDRNYHTFPVVTSRSPSQNYLSESVGWQNNLTETSTERRGGGTSNKHVPCSCKERFSGNVETKNCLVSDNCNIKTSTSPSSCHMSQQKIIVPTKLDSHLSDIYHTYVSCILKPEITEEYKTHLVPVTRDITTSQDDLDKENADPEETTSDLLVKCFCLDDKESFQHRYRLYFDDETLSQDSRI